MINEGQLKEVLEAFDRKRSNTAYDSTGGNWIAQGIVWAGWIIGGAIIEAAIQISTDSRKPE